MRRLAAAAALALGVVMAAPASAHTDSQEHFVDWEADAPEEGDRLHATDYVTAFARFDRGGVGRWRIEMKHEGGAVSACEKDVPDAPRDVSFRCNWDTNHLGDMTNLAENGTIEGPMAPNGRYAVTVTVWNGSRQCWLTCMDVPVEAHVLGPRTVIVENPVSQPAGVQSSFDSNSRSISVNWSPNPEPDIEKYVVQERVGEGTWSKVGERAPGSPSFTKQVTEPGTYQYRVSAVRPEVSQSAWSESAPIEVASIPEAPVSGGDGGGAGDGDDSGGDPGVFIPEESTTTTAPASAAPGAGAPSSAGSRPVSGGGSRLFTRPSTRSFRSTPSATTPTTEYDPGFSETLPYKTPQTSGQSDDEELELAGGEEPQTMTKLVTIPRPRDPRALLVPLAGGLTIFVFAMQMTVVVRKRPAVAATAGDDFDEWLGL